MSNNVTEELVNILLRKNLIPQSIVPELDSSTPIKHLSLDSLDMVDFILDIEQQYDIVIPHTGCIEENMTIGEVARNIEKLIDEKKKGK